MVMRKYIHLFRFMSQCVYMLRVREARRVRAGIQQLRHRSLTTDCYDRETEEVTGSSGLHFCLVSHQRFLSLRLAAGGGGVGGSDGMVVTLISHLQYNK